MKNRHAPQKVRLGTAGKLRSPIRPRRALTLTLFAALSAAPATYAADPGAFSFGVGGEYTTGDYGTSSTTDIWYFPVSARYETGPWLFRATVPYIIVQGTGNVVLADGVPIMSRGHIRSSRTTESGLGDVVTAATYNLVTEADGRPLVDLTGKVKFGTADETRGLGTGENDYAVQLDLAKSYDVMTFFGTVGYKIIGDTPTVNYNDVLYGTIGGERRFDTHSLGLMLDLQEATLPGTDGREELTGYFSRKLGGGSKFTAYVLKGFTNASPDWGIGVNFSFVPR